MNSSRAKNIKEVSTVCARDCPDTCGLNITIEEPNHILSVRGDPKHPVTQGFVCPRGAKDHIRLRKNRVDKPYIRKGDHLEESDWESSLSLVSHKLSETLEKYGPESILHLNYAGNTGLLTTAFPQRLWNAIGATQTDWALCSLSGHTGLALHYGSSYGTNPIELLSQNLIVFWGFNAAVSSSHMWKLAQRAQNSQKAVIIVVDPIKNKTAKKADLWIQAKPGSDVALAYGIINYLIKNNYIDHSFIGKWTQGFRELKSKADKWTRQRVEKVTGVGWNHLKQLGEAYADLKPSLTMIGFGLQKCDHGADQVRAVSFIPTLLGFHRGFFYSNAQAYSINKPLITGQTLSLKKSKIVPQVALADLVKQGKFRFIYVHCMNPAVTLPNQNAFRAGISKDNVFIAVHETHWTKTTEYADIVLPAPTYLEKDDIVIPESHNYVRYSNRVLQPITDSRDEIWIMREIAKQLGLTEYWLYEDAFKAMEQAMENAFEKGSFESLKSGEPLTIKRKPKNIYPTPSGKIEFYSFKAKEMSLNPLPSQSSLPVEKEKFVLLNSASSKYTHTQFQEVYGLIPAIVEMNPEDAKRLKIETGNTVVLTNDLGNIKVKAAISDTVPEGILWSPRQSEGLEGAPQNCLMSSEPQLIGGGPRFNSTFVTVSKS